MFVLNICMNLCYKSVAKVVWGKPLNVEFGCSSFQSSGYSERIPGKKFQAQEPKQKDSYLGMGKESKQGSMAREKQCHPLLSIYYVVTL